MIVLGSSWRAKLRLMNRYFGLDTPSAWLRLASSLRSAELAIAMTMLSPRRSTVSTKLR